MTRKKNCLKQIEMSLEIKDPTFAEFRIIIFYIFEQKQIKKKSKN